MALNSIVIAGQIVACQLSSTNDNKPVLKGMLEFTQVGKDAILGSVGFAMYGDRAKEAGELSGMNVIVEGNLDTVKKDNITTTFIVANAIHPGDVELSLNVVNLAGRCGQDPDAKYFESGNNKTTISLAANKTKTESNWFNLIFWGKTAGIVNDYVTKGSQIGVTGRLIMEAWTDRNSGNERTAHKVNCDRVELLGGKKQESGYDTTTVRQPVAAGAGQSVLNDIPF